MKLRPAVINDAPQLAAIIASFQALLTVDREGRGAEQFLESVSEQAIRGYIASERYKYIVADVDGSVAGFVAVRDLSHLFHLFVTQAHQGNGLGRSLWNEALRHILEKTGPKQITVNSSPNAVAFYAHLGFTQASSPVEKHGVVFIPMRLTTTHNNA
jgi:ribosomal protein S18 acetylase RimI-like enzyme